MSTYNHFRHPVETFKTAPPQLAATGLSAVACMMDVGAMLENSASGNLDSVTAISLAVCAIGGYLNGVGAKAQFELRDRLESWVVTNGYNDRVFKVTTKEWCTRQTARGVAERCGHLDDYEKLCNQNTKNAYFTRIPNF